MSPAKPSPRHVLLFLALAVCSGTLQARSDDRNQEAQIDAGHWIDDPDRGVQIFSQGFSLVQGTRHIRGERATVYRSDDGGFKRIVLEGAPAQWEEEMDDGAPMSARAQVIDYKLAEDLVVLKKDVVVNKQRDEITGEEIHYNLATQRLDGGRIRFTITPQNQPDGS